jgi:hypothetical protein
MTSRSGYRFSFGLGLLSSLAIVAAGMALQDVYHGEEDLTLEWSVLRVSFLVIIAFHAFALSALWSTIGVSDSNSAAHAQGEQPKVL